jgi:hypothetical protein
VPDETGGTAHPFALVLLNRLAVVLTRQNRDEAALPVSERFRALWRRYPCPGDAAVREAVFGADRPMALQVLLQAGKEPALNAYASADSYCVGSHWFRW